MIELLTDLKDYIWQRKKLWLAPLIILLLLFGTLLILAPGSIAAPFVYTFF